MGLIHLPHIHQRHYLLVSGQTSGHMVVGNLNHKRYWLESVKWCHGVWSTILLTYFVWNFQSCTWSTKKLSQLSVPLVVRNNFRQISVHSPVHHLNHTFWLRMQCRGPYLPNCQSLTDVLGEDRLEVSSLVRTYLEWNLKTANPVLDRTYQLQSWLIKSWASND